MSTPLTDAIIRKPENDPRAKPFDLSDGEQRNLKLTVKPSGLRVFTARYRALDKRKNKVVQRRAMLGTWTGKPGSMTIAQARVEARRLQGELDKKKDPVAERRLEQAPRTDTMEKLCELFIEKYSKVQKDDWEEDQRQINKDILPRLGHMAVRDIKRRDVFDLFEEIGGGKRNAPVQANRTKSLIITIFNFGITREWLDGNPALLIDKYPEAPRERYLTEDEIRDLWALWNRLPTTEEKKAPGRRRATHTAEGLPICPFSARTAAVQKIRLLTAKRGCEVVAMDWKELDANIRWWTIPSERSKNGKPDRAWLIDEARDIILALALDPTKPPKAGLVFADAHGAIPADRLKKAGKMCGTLLQMDATSHDLRRTAATYMAEAGVEEDTISLVLNHTKEGGAKTTRVYNLYKYDKEKQQALETWGRVFRDILANRRGEVVAFKTRS